MKPRLLFAPPKPQVLVEEEEAVTDIEENSCLGTPHKQSSKQALTPKAPRFAPASPPSTVRTRRTVKPVDLGTSPGPFAGFSGDDAEPEPFTQRLRGGRGAGREKVSPFDKWQRTKSSTTPIAGRKRDGDAIVEDSGEPSKRLRGHT
jgi:hypothetical protein